MFIAAAATAVTITGTYDPARPMGGEGRSQLAALYIMPGNALTRHPNTSPAVRIRRPPDLFLSSFEVMIAPEGFFSL